MSRYRVWTREFGSEEWAEVADVKLTDDGLIDCACLPPATYDIRVELAETATPAEELPS